MINNNTPDKNTVWKTAPEFCFGKGKCNSKGKKNKKQKTRKSNLIINPVICLVLAKLQQKHSMKW